MGKLVKKKKKYSYAVTHEPINEEVKIVKAFSKKEAKKIVMEEVGLCDYEIFAVFRISVKKDKDKCIKKLKK